MFNVGDLAVYPAHGVGRVEKIESKDMYGSEQLFYVLTILNNGMKIIVPTERAKTIGLREITPPEKIPEVYGILKSEMKSKFEGLPWNRRYKAYMDKIKSGSLFEVAEVLRDLFLLKKQKDLSFGERKVLDMAKSLLKQEVSIADGTQEDLIERKLDKLCA